MLICLVGQDCRGFRGDLVEPRGIEPLTSALRMLEPVLYGLI